MSITVLIVEDEQDVAELVSYGVRMNWPDCQVLIAEDGSEALRLLQAERPDLAVLDIGIPPPDGFEVLRTIRETSQMPVLMLTARGATMDKVKALELGADDYLTKPFDHLELLARLRALVRRATITGVLSQGQETAPPNPQQVEIGDLSVNYATREVRLRDKVLALTSTEYRLLEELVRHAGEVLTHRHLLERVWGPEYVGEDHYLKVFVRRLRSKLGDDADRPRYIQTEWSIGYRFIPAG
ncbi:MAG: two-component system, OmpR family, operon response regulator KdpE [Chloroflexia bacterium]|jgi:DNA-binding response OmpR family regulator|nr:two-component system, OmpR family, operon response regulator KdpE [Chloroflexia bacterium]